MHLGFNMLQPSRIHQPWFFPQVFNAADVVPIPELPQNRLEDLFAARAATRFVVIESVSGYS